MVCMHEEWRCHPPKQNKEREPIGSTLSPSSLIANYLNQFFFFFCFINSTTTTNFLTRSRNNLDIYMKCRY